MPTKSKAILKKALFTILAVVFWLCVWEVAAIILARPLILPHVPEVLLVHADEEVIVLIIPPGQEPGGVPLAGDAVLRQLAPRRGIDRVPDLLPGGGGGGDGETPLLPRPPDEVLHGVLRHRAPADIPMANEKNFCHQALFLSRSPGIGLSSAW